MKLTLTEKSLCSLEPRNEAASEGLGLFDLDGHRSKLNINNKRAVYPSRTFTFGRRIAVSEIGN
jgi:hypothetical protein